jgi:DNA-binding transcriptional regulator YiaG
MLQVTATQPLRTRLMSRAVNLAETEFYTSLVKQLRARREYLRLTQTDVAHLVGVSDYMVAKWENLMKMPTAFGLMCWCKALGVQVQVYSNEPTAH